MEKFQLQLQIPSILSIDSLAHYFFGRVGKEEKNVVTQILKYTVYFLSDKEAVFVKTIKCYSIPPFSFTR